MPAEMAGYGKIKKALHDLISLSRPYIVLGFDRVYVAACRIRQYFPILGHDMFLPKFELAWVACPFLFGVSTQPPWRA